MDIELLVSPGCPHVPAAASTLDQVVAALAPGTPIQTIPVATAEAAAIHAFTGSPSIRINGRDLENLETPEHTLACRLYEGGGPPPRWLIEAALLRALKPKGYLFLCVANSARSQLAEGIARSLAPEGVSVASAGSEPSNVRPEVVTVLDEVGIDAAAHHSKAIHEVPAEQVEAVITLCADEVCPLYLGHAHRVHWGLPDPAAVEGEGRLEAFREVREVLVKRFSQLFVD